MYGCRMPEVRRDIIHLCGEDLGWESLTSEVSRHIQKVVPFDASCWHTMDPLTLLLTGAVKENLGEMPLFPHYEYEIDDVNKWSFLASSSHPVGVLSEATRGNSLFSPRYRDLLQPIGLEWEIRGSCVSDSICWGAFGLYRTRGHSDFQQEEATFLRDISTILAEGFRRALLVSVTTHPQVPDGPGLILLDDSDRVLSITPSLLPWLEHLVQGGGSAGNELPSSIYAVAARARTAVHDIPASPPSQARARLHVGQGRWLVVHGLRLTGRSEGQTAVVVEPARPGEVAPLILKAYGLTPREIQVTQFVLQGISTRETAQRLALSPYTVQDHLKAVFNKIGVRSRGQLRERVFSDRYCPLREDHTGLEALN